jgi:hypothetical protein
LTAARERLGPHAWKAAEQAGTSLSFEDAVEFALEQIPLLQAAAPCSPDSAGTS